MNKEARADSRAHQTKAPLSQYCTHFTPRLLHHGWEKLAEGDKNEHLNKNSSRVYRLDFLTE
jgi:hypothetical protein